MPEALFAGWFAGIANLLLRMILSYHCMFCFPLSKAVKELPPDAGVTHLASEIPNISVLLNKETLQKYSAEG